MFDQKPSSHPRFEVKRGEHLEQRTVTLASEMPEGRAVRRSCSREVGGRRESRSPDIDNQHNQPRGQEQDEEHQRQDSGERRAAHIPV
jgi:hypothetical protein